MAALKLIGSKAAHPAHAALAAAEARVADAEAVLRAAEKALWEVRDDHRSIMMLPHYDERRTDLIERVTRKQFAGDALATARRDLDSAREFAELAAPEAQRRAELAEAIKSAEAAKSAAARGRAAIERASARIESAAREREDAKQRVADAIAAAASDAEGSRSSLAAIRAARDKEADAIDAVTVATAALANVEGGLADLEYEERQAQGRLNRAAIAVLATAIEPTVAAILALQVELNQRRAVLAFLSQARFADVVRSREADRVRAALEGRGVEPPDFDALSAPWQEALQQLARDPNAALPSFCERAASVHLKG